MSGVGVGEALRMRYELSKWMITNSTWRCFSITAEGHGVMFLLDVCDGYSGFSPTGNFPLCNSSRNRFYNAELPRGSPSLAEFFH